LTTIQEPEASTNLETNRPGEEATRLVATGAGLTVFVLGAAILAAWLTRDPEVLAWLAPRMKTNTAACLMLSGLTLMLTAWRRAPRLAGSLAVLFGGFATATLLEYVLGLDLHIDQLLAKDLPSPETMGLPNRMAPNTALVLASGGLALLLSRSGRPRAALCGQALALVMLGIAALASVGYLYDASILYQPTRYLRMSPYTAATATILALGLLALRPDLGLARLMVSQGPGGYLARRLVVLAALAPMALGYLRIEGERYGLYDTVTGTSLLVLLTVTTFLVMVVVLARTLDRVDVRRRQAETRLRRAGELTAALSQATTVDEVAEATVRRGLPALGAPAGGLMLLSPDGRELRMASTQGYSGSATSAYRTVPVDADLPACQAVRTQAPVFIGNPQQRGDRFPALAQSDRGTQAWAALPVQGRARVLGVLALGFDRSQQFDEAQREQLMQVARQCGQALDRALLFGEREETRALLETVLSRAPVGLAFLDRELRCVRVNAALAALDGLPAEHHVGRPLAEVAPPALAEVALPELREVLATNLPRSDRPFTLETAGAPGQVHHYLISYYPVPDHAGLPVGVGMVLVDVTGEQRAREGAEAANRAKDEFLAMLGHELRNPLSPILTALEMMKLRGDQTHQKERAIIGRQVQHLVRLIEDLLDVSRITRGKVELDLQRVELSDIVSKAVEVASPLFEQRVHRLNVSVAPGLAVMGDEHRLTQVMSNLLTNAAKYTEPGGQVNVLARAVDGQAVITVSDNGKGIPPALLPRIFDLFVQGYRAPDRSSGGLGLGLSIVRMLVSMHQGQVTATSEGPGRGSQFSVTLPLDSSAANDLGAPTTALPRPVGSSRRVLVVDDNRDAAELLAEALALEGHETRVAYDGLSALGIAAELRPELAFLDIGLPVMDGYDLARRLRALLPGPLVLVAVTGYGQPSDRARSAQAGFDEHLVKPISIETALAIVDGTWKPASASDAAS
jgi:PAS domain S-box-containing protein